MIRQSDLLKINAAGITVYKISGSGSLRYITRFEGNNRWAKVDRLPTSEVKYFIKNLDHKSICLQNI